MTDRIDRLEQALAALAQRMDAVEAQHRVSPGGLDVVLLDRLANRRGGAFESDRVRGGLSYAGSIHIDERPLVWQRELAAPASLEAAGEGLAALLGALGHTARVQILQHLCLEPTTSAELAERLQLSSTGKLYHHLDKLTAVGLVRQTERGVWEVAPEKVIPVLVLLGVARDLA